MIRQHPGRVLLVTGLVAIGFFLLSFPGARATGGAWYYISSVGWFGFLITALVFIVLLAIVVMHKMAGHTHSEGQ